MTNQDICLSFIFSKLCKNKADLICSTYSILEKGTIGVKSSIQYEATSNWNQVKSTFVLFTDFMRVKYC